MSEQDELSIIYEAEERPFFEDIGELKWTEKRRTKPCIFDKYLKGDFLGEGTFAKVFEVLDVHTLERRAVKVFDLNVIEKKIDIEESRKLISQEIKLLSSLDHRNVIKIVDVIRLTSESSSTVNTDEEDKIKPGQNKICMFMEYCVSNVEEIIESLTDHRIPKWQSLKYFRDLVEGLIYLHSRGVVHKDIKPQNMLVNIDDTIKITDLGVCHFVSPFETDICTNTYGTYAYQAPELLAEDSSFQGFKVDIWASGVVLYRMITGDLPFESNKLLDLIESIVNNNYRYNQIVAQDIFLDDLLSKILEKNPPKRISLEEIKTHPWFVQAVIQDTPPVKIPSHKLYVDDYRSMTITPYLHEMHFPLPPSENQVNVSESTLDDFNAERKIPILRSNRTLAHRRKKRKPKSKWCKVNRRFIGVMGLKTFSEQKLVKLKKRTHSFHC